VIKVNMKQGVPLVMRVLLDTNAYSAMVEGRSEVAGRFRQVTPALRTAELFGELFASLRKRGKPIPTNDIWIAAQAIERNSSLLSSDPHFGFVEGLSWLSFSPR
jgi:predicted nucleic acid-binding protein